MSRIRLRTARCTPALAAIAAGLVGFINVASALTPNIRWRGRLLLDVEPVEAVRLFHAFALPAGAALLLVSPYLLKRRRRAWQLAIGLMLVLGVLDLLKGLDVEETVLSWATAAMLAASATEFRVEHDAITLRSSVWRVPLLGAFGLSLAALAAWVSQGHPSFGAVVRETGDLLAWQAGPLRFEQHAIGHHAFAWVPLSVHLVEIGTLLAMAYVVFRPLAGPASLPGPAARRAAAALVRAHGSDTPSFFKLRADKHYFFSSDRSAFVGYQVQNGVRLLSGDPVGPDGALAGLLADLKGFAQTRGLKLAAVGASERPLPLWERLGLRTMYLGDEAIIEVGEFSLDGRPIRKVRQSVSRLRKAGYAAELHRVSELAPAVAAEVEEVLERGREGAPERGFSMAMDSLRGDHGQDTLVVVARDEEHAVRGVLHFVPCFGRTAMSLSFMRRDPGTPNGLTEFMVVSAVELLRERGVDEMSLNFAAFARWIHSPERPAERAIGRLIALGNRFFQIESLYRFNATFFPRWQPRYLVYQGALGLPRASPAAMWAEGQIPKPELPRGRSSTGMRLMARAR
jgi:lysyl-tRNA synthetase class 2